MAETLRLGEKLAAELPAGGVVLLFGDMGSGKTTLTQGVARGLGIDVSEVQSPTFTLMREHMSLPRAGDAERRLVHIDLYRLDPSEVGSLGLEQLFAEDSVKVVEWSERFLEMPEADLVLHLERGTAPDERTISELSPSEHAVPSSTGFDEIAPPAERRRNE